jgi:hypothetical protein
LTLCLPDFSGSVEHGLFHVRSVVASPSYGAAVDGAHTALNAEYGAEHSIAWNIQTTVSIKF